MEGRSCGVFCDCLCLPWTCACSFDSRPAVLETEWGRRLLSLEWAASSPVALPAVGQGLPFQSCFSNLSLASEPVANCHSFWALCLLPSNSLPWKSHIGQGLAIVCVTYLAWVLHLFIKVAFKCPLPFGSKFLVINMQLVACCFSVHRERGCLLFAGTGSQRFQNMPLNRWQLGIFGT